MTISSTDSRKTYAGNGVNASFATSPVVFYDTGDLVVYVTDDATGDSETLVENTDYTVTGGDGSTGTVDLSGGASPYGAPAADFTLVIQRDVPATQGTDFVNNDASDAEAVETALDRLTILCQQIGSRLLRAFRLSDSDVTGAATTIGTPVAGQYLRWKTPVTDGLESVEIANASLISLPVAVADGGTASTTAAGARTALGAAASGANTDITSLNAPSLGGATATTQTAGNNTTKVATTEFVTTAVGGGGITLASTTEVLTGTDAAKAVTSDALAALWEQGSDITAAATISVGEGGYFTVTGNTGITDIDFATDKAGRHAVLRFTGTPQLTHSATLFLNNGGSNITIAAGDIAFVWSEAADTVRVVVVRADGRAINGPSATGTGASGTWGISITGTASGNLSTDVGDLGIGMFALGYGNGNVAAGSTSGTFSMCSGPSGNSVTGVSGTWRNVSSYQTSSSTPVFGMYQRIS